MQALADVIVQRVVTRLERLFEAIFGLQCLRERPIVSSMQANRDLYGDAGVNVQLISAHIRMSTARGTVFTFCLNTYISLSIERTFWRSN